MPGRSIKGEDILLDEPVGGEEEENNNLDDEKAGSDEEKQKASQKSKEGAWISQLPKELRDKFDPKEIPTQVSLANKYLELKLKQEENSKNASNEGDKVKIYTEDDYKELDDLLKDKDKEDLNVIDVMKKNNVPPEDIKNLIVNNSEAQKQMFEVKRQLLATDLRSRWGDSYDANKAFYNRAVKVLYPEDDGSRIMEKGLHLDPDFIDIVSKYGKACSEGIVPQSKFAQKKKTDAEILFGSSN